MALEELKPERERELVRRSEVDQRPHEVVPRAYEGEDRYHGQAGFDERKHDAPVDAERAAPIYARRVLQFERNRQHELAHEEYIDCPASEPRAHRKRLEGIQPTQVAKHEIDRNHGHLRWQHHGGESHDEEHVPARPAETREAVPRKRRSEKHAENDRPCDHARVLEVQREGQRCPPFDEVAPNHRARDPLRRKGHHFLLSLQGRRDHPEERQQHDDGSGTQDDECDAFSCVFDCASRPHTLATLGMGESEWRFRLSRCSQLSRSPTLPFSRSPTLPFSHSAPAGTQRPRSPS